MIRWNRLYLDTCLPQFVQPIVPYRLCTTTQSVLVPIHHVSFPFDVGGAIIHVVDACHGPGKTMSSHYWPLCVYHVAHGIYIYLRTPHSDFIYSPIRTVVIDMSFNVSMAHANEC
jgi:hypothetical protein